MPSSTIATEISGPFASSAIMRPSTIEDERLAAGLARVEPRLLERDAHAVPARVGLAGGVDAGHARCRRGSRAAS